MASVKAEMTMDPIKVVAAFVKNRAELLELDVTADFIVPPFFDRLVLAHDRKAVSVIGGRGCGKTMFLRYLSYPTQLSQQRGAVSSLVFGQGIGLYWKPDTGFCDLMKPGWLDPNEADRAFIHHLAIVVLGEFTAFIDTLAATPIDGRTLDLRGRALPEHVRVMLPKDVIDYATLGSYARIERMRLSHWVQNPKLERPIFLRINDLLEALIEDIASHDKALAALFVRVLSMSSRTSSHTSARLYATWSSNRPGAIASTSRCEGIQWTALRRALASRLSRRTIFAPSIWRLCSATKRRSNKWLQSSFC